MSRYLGDTYSIPLERGGFCHNKNIDTIDPFDMVDPSCNVWLNEGGIRKRGGTVHVDTNIMFTIGDPDLTGAGLDDLSSGSAYAHTAATVYTVELTHSGTPDKFRWQRTGEGWSAIINITGAEQTLDKGFKITFAATTGHTVGDCWAITIAAPEVMGLFDFWLANGNQKIVRVTADGKVWKTNAVTIKEGWTINKLASFVQTEDII